jgi:hypothetical protein
METLDGIALSDLAAAALLIANGCRLRGLKPSDTPGRALFVIAGPAALIRGLLASYERGDAVVRVEAFLAAERLLKDRLFRRARLSQGRGADPQDAA